MTQGQCIGALTNNTCEVHTTAEEQAHVHRCEALWFHGKTAEQQADARTWSSVQSQGRPPMKSLWGESCTTVFTMSRFEVSIVGSGSVGPSITATLMS